MADGPLSGRVAVVTGASSGIGEATAVALSSAGAAVALGARRRERLEALADRLEGPASVHEVDLADEGEARSFIEAAQAEYGALHILVNNAGVMGIPQQRTADGFEMQLGVNHLGHFALTALLLPTVLRSPDARVVSVTSTGRHIGRALDPANPHLIGRYDPWRAYGQSKLANVHFALELDRRFRATGIPARSIVVHPGFTYTDLQERSVRETAGGWSQRFFRAAVRRFGMTPSQGALVLLRAATDPAAVGGALYTPMWVVSGPPVRRPMFGRSRDPKAMAVLWELSERETGISLRIEPR